MGVLKPKPAVEDHDSWIWRIVILVIVILFLVGFYLLLGGNFSLNGFGDDSDDSGGGSWLDGLGGGSDNSDEDVIPAPPALPS